MRWVEYSVGAGRLTVGDGWLVFIADGQHSSVRELERAARSKHPGRAIATAVAQSGFEVPPFIFARAGERLHGMVYGPVKLLIDDGDVATVDGLKADPWAHFSASASATLMYGDTEFKGGLWVGLGVVYADGFRWFHRSSGTAAIDSLEPPESAPEERVARPGSEAAVDSSRDASGPEPVPQGARDALLEALDSEIDSTTETIRLADFRGPDGKRLTSQPKGDGDVARSRIAGVEPESEIASNAGEDNLAVEQDVGADDQDVTIDVGPGQVMLDNLFAERRMVDALVCTGCENPNPPSAARCRHCGSPLTSSSTAVRRVPQPVLGVIHLSGNREELLDADLLIGRNPGHLPLDPHQRLVVHAEEDRSISRRHIMLELKEWKVMATNLQESGQTTLESSEGRRTKLEPGVPQHLESGDTIHFGSAWLRFEAEE